MLDPMNPDFLLTKALLAAGSLSGVFGFTLAEIWTNQWLLSAGAAVVASIAGGGIVAAFSKIITARAAARSTDSESREAATSNLFRRLESVRAAEVAFYRSRLDFKDMTSALERKSKHRALSECQALISHINLLEGLLREADVEPPAFTPKTYVELVGDEDRQIEEMAMGRFKQSASVVVPTV